MKTLLFTAFALSLSLVASAGELASPPPRFAPASPEGDRVAAAQFSWLSYFNSHSQGPVGLHAMQTAVKDLESLTGEERKALNATLKPWAEWDAWILIKASREEGAYAKDIAMRLKILNEVFGEVLNPPLKEELVKAHGQAAETVVKHLQEEIGFTAQALGATAPEAPVPASLAGPYAEAYKAALAYFTAPDGSEGQKALVEKNYVNASINRSAVWAELKPAAEKRIVALVETVEKSVSPEELKNAMADLAFIGKTFPSELGASGSGDVAEHRARAERRWLALDATGPAEKELETVRQGAAALLGASSIDRQYKASYPLVRAAKETEFEAVKIAAIQGLMDGIARSKSHQLAQYVDHAVYELANATEASNQLKALTAALLRRDAGLENYRWRGNGNRAYAEIIDMWRHAGWDFNPPYAIKEIPRSEAPRSLGLLSQLVHVVIKSRAFTLMLIPLTPVVVVSAGYGMAPFLAAVAASVAVLIPVYRGAWHGQVRVGIAQGLTWGAVSALLALMLPHHAFWLAGNILALSAFSAVAAALTFGSSNPGIGLFFSTCLSLILALTALGAHLSR